jgi:hypothetical protein
MDTLNLVICHCLLNWFFRRISSSIWASIRGHESSLRQHLEVDCASTIEMALDSLLTHATQATSFDRSGLDGSPTFRLEWNLDQSVLKSGWSSGFRKDDWHHVLISTGNWSVLSPEHDVVRYTGVTRSFAMMMSRASGMGKKLHGMVVGVSGMKIRQEYSLAQSQKPLPLGCVQPRIPVHMHVIQGTHHQTGKLPPGQADRSKLMKGWRDNR